MVEILALVDSLGEGAAVPSERELAARLGMARETVRQALRDLLVEGRIRRCHGRATVVAGPKIVQPLSIESYTEGVRKQGREAWSDTGRPRHQPADAALARHPRDGARRVRVAS